MLFFFPSRRRHTRCSRDWSSDVCSSDLGGAGSTRRWFLLSTGAIEAGRLQAASCGGCDGYCQPAGENQCAGLSRDRKSTRLNSSHGYISYAVFCLKKKKNTEELVNNTLC